MHTCLAPEFHLLLALLPSDQLAESADMSFMKNL